MSTRPEEQPVAGSAESELHDLSVAKLSIQTDACAFDTDEEPLDVSNPELGTWATCGPAARLTDIALLFRNPVTLQDDNYMLQMEEKNGSGQTVLVLKRILSEMRSLAVVTPLIALLMVESNTGLRNQVSSIVARVSNVAETHRKQYTDESLEVYQMKDVIGQINALRQLMHTDATVSREAATRLEQMQGYLIALSREVYDYVENSFKHEEYPKWYIDNPSPSQSVKLRQWNAERPTRIIAAYHKAIDEYMSVTLLRKAIGELKPRTAPSASNCNSSKKAPSDTPSFSKDTGPQGSAIFIIDSDSDDD